MLLCHRQMTLKHSTRLRRAAKCVLYFACRTMQTLYFIVLTVLGGLFTLFGAAGWSSYTSKKIPDTAALFRWFVAGVLGAGLGSYAWLFGFNGDPTKLLEQMGEALEVDSTMKTLSGAVGGVTDTVEKMADAAEEITVGMPNF